MRYVQTTIATDTAHCRKLKEQVIMLKKPGRATVCNDVGNSSNVGLRAGYLRLRTAGGASNRRWQKACLINGLIYLFLWWRTVDWYASPSKHFRDLDLYPWPENLISSSLDYISICISFGSNSLSSVAATELTKYLWPSLHDLHLWPYDFGYFFSNTHSSDECLCRVTNCDWWNAPACRRRSAGRVEYCTAAGDAWSGNTRRWTGCGCADRERSACVHSARSEPAFSPPG